MSQRWDTDAWRAEVANTQTQREFIEVVIKFHKHFLYLENPTSNEKIVAKAIGLNLRGQNSQLVQGKIIKLHRDAIPKIVSLAHKLHKEIISDADKERSEQLYKELRNFYPIPSDSMQQQDDTMDESRQKKTNQEEYDDDRSLNTLEEEKQQTYQQGIVRPQEEEEDEKDEVPPLEVKPSYYSSFYPPSFSNLTEPVYNYFRPSPPNPTMLVHTSLLIYCLLGRV